MGSARLGECQTETADLTSQAGIDHLRAEADNETANQGGVDAEVDVDL